MSLEDAGLGLDSIRKPPLPMPCAYLPRLCFFFFAISKPSSRPVRGFSLLFSKSRLSLTRA